MAINAKMLGREAVMRKLQQLVPEAEKQLAEAQIEAAVDLANAIRARAPKKTGNYRESIKGGRLEDNPGEPLKGIRQTKDKNATGVFANFRWRFLEFGTKAHLAEAPRRDRRYKKRLVMTKGKRAHAATRAIPHIFPTYRGMKNKIRRKMANAVNRAVRKVRGR